MFVDTITLIIKAGNGGNGSVHFLHDGRSAKGGPDGGNGGNGGNVYVQGSHDLNDLSSFSYKKKIQAKNGIDGRGQKLFGKNAPHEILFVPIGTEVTNIQTGRKFEVSDASKKYLIARGGTGGRGNTEFKSPTNRTPDTAEKGGIGEELQYLFDLRIIAHVGLIGLPNAGKSSLLAQLTNATPKIGNYPFTTLEPNIGVMDTYLIADIPGLIEGASTGRGLGTKFLKHIEKTKILIHCIDAGSDYPLSDYDTVRHEFYTFNPALLDKPEIILITKSDVSSPETLNANVRLFAKQGKSTLICSIYNPDLVAKVRKTILRLLSERKSN